MSNHTPGPWTTKIIINDRGSLEIKVRSADQYVADVWETLPKRSQSVANARLIAAAPETKRQRDELIEGLSDLLNELEEMGLASMPGDTFEGLRAECKHSAGLINKLSATREEA